MKGLKESYKVGERVKFRVGARKRYIQKTFSNFHPIKFFIAVRNGLKIFNKKREKNYQSLI